MMDFKALLLRKRERHQARPRARWMGDRLVVNYGLRKSIWGDVYHYSLILSWPAFFATAASLFVLINLLFAGAYDLGHEPIANLTPNSFWGLFFFSVETLATVGYGDMHPQTVYGHMVSSVEIFVGMCSVALATGVIFARFSQPRARVLFSENPVIGPIEGRTTLSVRAANARQNSLLDANVRMHLLRNEITLEGMPIRRVYDLALVRAQHPVFVLGWTIMHVIDEQSPLWGEDAQSLERSGAGIFVTLCGTDETTHQTLLTRHSFSHDELHWNRRLVDWLGLGENGEIVVDYRKFHQTEDLGRRDPNSQ